MDNQGSIRKTFQGLNYSISQNNVPFPPPDDLVWVGKNSQIKARKSEQGQCI
jgi:hypothetical protein